jgi:Ca-activated chloride channel family protein
MLDPRFFLLLGVLGLSSPLFSQDASQKDTISVDVVRVVLHATVREAQSGFVSDLEKEHFTVLEDGVPQKLLSFSREDEPIAVGLLVDNSQSMMNKRSHVVAAAKAFVGASKPNDEIFVLHFNEQLTYGLPSSVRFTGDRGLLEAALDKTNLDGRTALYDAIYEGLKNLKHSNLSKKVLLVISDGGDNMSVHKASDVVREADLSGALFFGIGIYDPMDGDANPGVLRKLAKDTGGEAYFPKDLIEIKGLCEAIARDLRNQYALTYAPLEHAASKYHRVQVKVKDPKGRKLIVRTRTGYYSKGFQSEDSETP